MEMQNFEEPVAATAAVLKVQSPRQNDDLSSKTAIQTTESTEKSSDSPQTSPLKKMTSSKVFLIGDCIQGYNVQGISIFKLSPQLHLHQAIDYKVPAFEVKVKLEDVNEQIHLWDTFVGYAKRELFIHDGFIYSLEKNNTGYFVDSIWRLDTLFQVYYDRDDSKFRLVFTEGKITKNRDFWIKEKQPFITRLREELEKMGISFIGS